MLDPYPDVCPCGAIPVLSRRTTGGPWSHRCDAHASVLADGDVHRPRKPVKHSPRRKPKPAKKRAKKTHPRRREVGPLRPVSDAMLAWLERLPDPDGFIAEQLPIARAYSRRVRDDRWDDA